MKTLDFLERIEVHNQRGREYVTFRAIEVLRHIIRLRRFASLKPSKVANIVNVQADSLQERLDKVLGK